jgi:hypothetical protein
VRSAQPGPVHNTNTEAFKTSCCQCVFGFHPRPKLDSITVSTIGWPRPESEWPDSGSVVKRQFAGRGHGHGHSHRSGPVYICMYIYIYIYIYTHTQRLGGTAQWLFDWLNKDSVSVSMVARGSCRFLFGFNWGSGQLFDLFWLICLCLKSNYVNVNVCVSGVSVQSHNGFNMP